MYRLKRENATSTDGKSTVQADKDRFKINIDGKSTQATRSGKNKFNLDYIRDSSALIKTDTGVNLVNTWAGDIFTNEDTLKTFKPNTTYTMKAKAKVVSRPSTIVSKELSAFRLYRPNSGELGTVWVSVLNMPDKETIALNTEKEYITSFTTPADMTNVRVLSYTFYGNNDGSTTGTIQGEIDVSEIMLVEGTYTAENFPDFELYGVSPSPDYPSEIKSVGDDVNLFDKDNATITSLNCDGGTTFYNAQTIKSIIFDCSKYEQLAISKKIGNYFSIIASSKYPIAGVAGVIGTRLAIDDTKSKDFFSINCKDYNYLTIVFWRNTDTITESQMLDTIKIQKGDKPTPYSKYGEGTLNIEQSSSNLFNASKITNTTISVLDSGKTIKMPIDTRGNGYTNVGTNLKGVCPKLKVGDTVYLLGDTTSQKNKFIYLGGNSKFTWEFGKSKTLTENDLNAAFVLYGNNFEKGETEQVTISNLRIVKNASDEWEQYFNNTYTLPLSAPLRSLDNGTKDTKEVDGIHRLIGNYVCDGTETVTINNQSVNTFRIENIPNAYTESNNVLNGALCSHFKEKVQSKVSSGTIGFAMLGGNINKVYICFGADSEINTVEKVKQWLAEQYAQGTPLIFQYELAEEVVEPFTEEQLEVINSMVTEKGTNIFNINEDTGITLNYTPEFTDEIKHAFKYGITRGYLEVLDGSGLIINEDNYLQSIDFDDERYVDGEGIIGTTVAKSLEGKFINVDSEFSVENKELQAYIGAELDNGTTKYIDLGTFIVQKPDNNNVTDNTSFNALDYMVKFNKIYVDNITYPCTLGELLQNVCDQVNVILKTKTFRNSTFEIENNPFINNESCREVIKAIAQIAFSWARINQDNELVLDFNLSDKITETINNDEYYELKDNEQYGPVNTIILRNSQVEGENYTIIDPNKLSTDKTCELVINDNPFAYTQAKRQELIQAGSALFGFKYIPLTTKTIGSVYLNCQDKLRVKNMQDKDLDTYIFNNKISYDGRITDTKETSAMTETETKYQFTDTMANKLNAKMARTEIVVDKANQQITAVVEQIGDRSEKTTTITADIDGLNSKVSQIEDITNETSSTTGTLILENCQEGPLLELKIFGNNNVFKYLYPSDTLYPSNTLYPYGDSRIIVTNFLDGSEIGTSKTYELGVMDVLRQSGSVRDEYILEKNQAKIIRRINKDGSIKDNEEIEKLGEIHIDLEKGKNVIQIQNYTAEMYCKYAIQNEYTDIFATKVEMNSSITQTAEEINLEVRKKVDENEVISKINQSAEQIQIEADKISFKRKRI